MGAYGIINNTKPVKKTDTKQSFWSKALDVLNTFGYGSAGIAKDIVGGPAGFNPIKAAKTGVKEKTTYSDVLGEAGWNPTSKAGKIAKGVVGFAGDIFLDPTTYLGIGGVTKAGKAAKAGKLLGKTGEAIKFADTLGDQAKLGQRALLTLGGKSIVPKKVSELGLGALSKAGEALKTSKLTGGAVDTLGKAFNTKYITGKTTDIAGAKATKEALQQARFIRKAGEETAGKFATGLKKLQKQAQKLGASGENVDEVLNLVEKRLPYTGTNKKLAELHSEMTDFAKGFSDNYWIHLLNPELKDERGFRALANMASPFTGSDVARKYKKIADTGEIVNIKTGQIFKDGKEVRKLSSGEIKAANFINNADDVISSLNPKIQETLNKIGGKDGLSTWGNKLLKAKDELINEEISYLKSSMGRGVEQGKVFRDIEGEVIGRSGRLSLNDPWYQEFYKINNRKPSNSELYEIAVKRLKEGDPLMQIPANDNYRKLEEVLSNVEDIKKSIPTSLNITDGTIAEINKALGQKKFSTDIPLTAFEMGRRQAKKDAGNYFVDEMKKIGKKAEEVPEYFQKLDPDEFKAFKQITGRGFDDLKGLYFDPEIVKDIKKVATSFSDQGTEGMLKAFDAVQNTWKRWTLGIFPAYHSRNMVGNFWNNYLAGVKNPKYYTEASQLQKAATLYAKDPEKYAKYAKQAEEVANMKNLGVVQAGFYGADIPSTTPNILTRGKKITDVLVGEKNPAIKAGMAVSSAIENNARIAHYLAKTAEGLSPQDAANSVRKYLFDYADLTDFERNILKRVLPFYTWTRKNIPLQLENIITQPGKYAKIGKARDVAAKNVQPVEGKGSEVAIPLYVGKDGKTRYLDLMSWLPAADIAKTGIGQAIQEGPKAGLAEAGRNFISMLTPIAKAPLEQYTNKNFYFNSEIEKYPGQPEKFLGMTTTKKNAQLLKNVRLLNEINRQMGTNDLTTKENLLRNLGLKINVSDPENDKKWADIAKDKTARDIEYDIKKYKKKGDKEVVAYLKELLKQLESK